MQCRQYAATVRSVALDEQDLAIDLGINGIGPPEPDYRRVDAVVMRLSPEQALQLHRLLEAAIRPRLVAETTHTGKVERKKAG
jgi:hypothetical protein